MPTATIDERKLTWMVTIEENYVTGTIEENYVTGTKSSLNMFSYR